MTSHIAGVTLFDPQEGLTVRAPEGSGPGWWAGAPGVLWDEEAARFYLYYRLRQPRPGRGYECRLAESEDGVQFRDLWAARKEEFPTLSMERAALVKVPGGPYRLYVGLVDADGRWGIDLVEAEHPRLFRVDRRRPVLRAPALGLEGVKDPWIRRRGGQWWMWCSYAPRPAKQVSAQEMHGSGDVYDTGLTKSHSGLAVSNDGVEWEWRGDVLSPGQGWEAYCARISCAIESGGAWLALYDGSASVAENYEERTGLAVSSDGVHFASASESGPLLVSPHGRGSLRYLDLVEREGWRVFYYEYCLADGSHELRVSQVKR